MSCSNTDPAHVSNTHDLTLPVQRFAQLLWKQDEQHALFFFAEQVGQQDVDAAHIEEFRHVNCSTTFHHTDQSPGKKRIQPISFVLYRFQSVVKKQLMMRTQPRKDQDRFHNYGATKCVVVYKTPPQGVASEAYEHKRWSAPSQYQKLPEALDCNILFIMKYNPLRWLVTQVFPWGLLYREHL